MAIHFLISEELVLGPLETSRVVKKSWNLGPGLKPYQRKNLQQLVVESSRRSTICKTIAFFCQESTFQQIQVCSELSFLQNISEKQKMNSSVQNNFRHFEAKQQKSESESRKSISRISTKIRKKWRKRFANNFNRNSKTLSLVVAVLT